MTIRGIGLFALVMLGACSVAPKTDAELIGEAQTAVDGKLDRQATFSMMEAVASKRIACGHASADDQSFQIDFVYENGTIIMEGDSGYDGALQRCDAAVASSPVNG